MPNNNFLELLDESNEIIVIDHHKKIETKRKITFHHNTKKSASQLVWEYIYKNKNYPKYINYIADRDLYKFALKNSEIINNGFYILGLTKTPNDIEKLSGIRDYSEIETSGKVFKKIKDDNLKYIVSNSKFAIDPYGNNVAITDCPRQYRSDAGNEMMNLIHPTSKKNPNYSVIWKYVPDIDEYWISLRSNGFDVTSVFKEYGCGGHKRAGGFTLKNKKLKDIFKFC